MAGIKHGTLTANTVATVTVDVILDLSDPGGQSYNDVEVVNVDGAAEIYYTLAANATPATPTIAGDDCHVLPAAIGGQTHVRRESGSTTVKLISSGTPKYSVRGV